MSNSNNNKPSIVLVHGAFADGSSWQKVIAVAQKSGFKVTAVQNPLKSLAEDTATTKRVIDAQEGEVILVGHSYGGSVITEAAAGSSKVKALVYVAAFVPDVGEAAGGLMGTFPPPPLATALEPDAAGFLYINRTKFQEVFAQDLAAPEAAALGAAQKPIAASIFGEPATAAAWKTIPSWYVVVTQDRAINPELERFMAKRANARITEIDSSHVAYISRPKEIINVIEAAAAATTK